ncbi:hypothetical protein [Marinobacterium jannaschii]|uniref:hypothetical protein n=1 Tax=Marinobacterium jannaschii TaxID=64970 RepID=UPI0004819385|nr:hypothetical protein [Marinobacterium jannaschii]
MKQQINLYQSRKVLAKDPLDLNSAALIALVAVLLMAAASGGAGYYLASEKQFLTELRTSGNRLEERTQVLEERLRTLVPDAELIQGVKTLKDELVLKRELIKLVGETGFAGGRGFSPYMLGLAQASRSAIAISELRINLRLDQVFITGLTSSPAEIPLLLEDLGKAEAFSNVQVGDFSITEQEPLHKFSLQTFIKRD